MVEALVGLGWSARQAGDAVESVTGGGPEGGSADLAAMDPAAAASEPDVAVVLRSALRHLGRAG